MNSRILTILAALSLVACSKMEPDQTPEPTPVLSTVSFTALAAETSDSNVEEFSTRASAESVIRQSWSAGDRILAYTSASGAVAKVGELSIKNDGYVAQVTGTLDVDVEDQSILLIYAPSNDNPIIVGDGYIDVYLARLSDSSSVCYALITDYTEGMQVSFKFANCFLKFYMLNLPFESETGEHLLGNIEFSEASGFNNAIRFTFTTDSEVSVTGTSIGDGILEFYPAGLTYASGDKGAFTLVTPPFDYGRRTVTINYMILDNETHDKVDYQMCVSSCFYAERSAGAFVSSIIEDFEISKRD